ncbi:hypothetical protein AKO1_013456 [Acrasis kona]|uniref:Uncharacterized protein n=1 Tax=Acrasis kona TaxID=1008807 RepID=A0AAW2ZJX0_9EUKA
MEKSPSDAVSLDLINASLRGAATVFKIRGWIFGWHDVRFTNSGRFIAYSELEDVSTTDNSIVLHEANNQSTILSQLSAYEVEAFKNFTPVVDFLWSRTTLRPRPATALERLARRTILEEDFLNPDVLKDLIKYAGDHQVQEVLARTDLLVFVIFVVQNYSATWAQFVSYGCGLTLLLVESDRIFNGSSAILKNMVRDLILACLDQHWLPASCRLEAATALEKLARRTVHEEDFLNP